MKRILLSLAAVAALASCVKENNLAPVAGQLTISAVSADSKTLLDGYDVVWEKTDKIAVVVSDGTTAEFSAVESTVSGSEADFVGTVSTDWANVTSAYAVYPAAAAGKTHTLPAVQNGEVSGLMLSTAVLDVEDMQKGASKAEFYNALTLLQVVVPDGVQEVKFSADMYSTLVGEVDFSVDAATGAVTFTKTNATRHLTLKAEGGLEAKTYSLLVYPGKVNDLTLHMVGLDGAEYTNTVANLEFAAGEARKIDLTKIFNVATEELHVVLPAGGTVEVPVVTTDHYQYEVSMIAGADAWVSYTLTKSFHKETIVFTVAENDTNSDREAEVTITWGDGKTKKFKIQQKNIFMDFVNDADGNPIQWEETFGLYEDSALDIKLTTFTNVFTIALSDDFSKGTYKVSNLFLVDSYWSNSQQITNKGGEYYANYNADRKELTILKTNSVSGYTFSGDVVLTYDVENKAFSAGTISATLLNGSAHYGSGATRYIGNYAAVVKVNEPANPEEGGDPIAGVWNVTCNFSSNVNNALTSQTGTMKIVKSGDSYIIEQFMGANVSWQLSQSGNTFTCATLMNTSTYTSATFVYDEANKTLTVSGEYTDWQNAKFSEFTATKK